MDHRKCRTLQVEEREVLYVLLLVLRDWPGRFVRSGELGQRPADNPVLPSVRYHLYISRAVRWWPDTTTKSCPAKQGFEVRQPAYSANTAI
jgi:hypothetical protein